MMNEVDGGSEYLLDVVFFFIYEGLVVLADLVLW